MSIDYDTLKTAEPADLVGGDGTEVFSVAMTSVLTTQELDGAGDEPLELALERYGAAEELTVPVIPRLADEFTCAGCYLVQHNSRAARRSDTGILCPECA